MDNSKSIIADAFNKLKETISDEHAHEFASTKLEDVWKAVREIDSSQRQRQSAQNLGRIKPLLQGIEKYSKVIEVLCNGTPYLPYIWAPIKLMVQFASQHYDVFESLLAAYADIGAVLPRFDRYEKAFSDIPSFRVALATMYQNILDFHRKAYKLLSRKAWHVLFLSLWRDYKTRFSGIIEGLKKQRDFLDTEAMSIHMSESKDARQRLQNEIQENQKNSLAILEQFESKAKISRLQHAVAWLSVDDKTQEDNYERISNRRHDETCVWVANNNHFLSWRRDDGKNPVLWLSGKPGAGKSVICSYILQLLGQSPGQHHICYYFCNSQESGNICGQILRTIALQLLRRNVDLASLLANQYVYPGTSCGMAQLRNLLPQMLETTDSTRIIIDGLDECSEETQMSVLKDLLRLLGKDVNCKTIIASRREVKIAEKLSGKPQIQLDGREEVESDIRLYVKYKVGSIETDDSDLRLKIESILVEKANGMFLWVRLVAEELRSCGSDWELEQTAKSLPRGLKQAYGRILDRIMDENHSGHARSLAIRILEWIACSYRPLKIFELLDGIVFKVGCMELNNRTKMRKSVLDFCRPLIEEGPSNTVDFVHFSAKEYILDEEYRHATTFISRETANLNISFSCVAYLNTSLGLLPHTSTSQSRAVLVLSGFHGLHLYANQFFTKHLEAYCTSLAASRGRVSLELIAELQKLLQFSKYTTDTSSLPNSTVNLEALHEFPQLISFLQQLIAFRAGLKQEDASSNMSKSPEDVSIESCSSDPTHFSNTRHLYQETVEALLSPYATHNFPEVDSRALENFSHIYGAAAFVCRYIYCSKATDGFDTLKKREAHEAAHQRKFRCADPSCASFAAGFTTRNALNRHNEKWHRIVTEFASLLVLLPGNPSTRVYSLHGTPRLDRRTSGQRPRPGVTSDKQPQMDSPVTADTEAIRTGTNRIGNGNNHRQTSVGGDYWFATGNMTQNSLIQQYGPDLTTDQSLLLSRRPTSISVRRGNKLPKLSPEVMIHRQPQLTGGYAQNVPGDELEAAVESVGDTTMTHLPTTGDPTVHTHQSLLSDPSHVVGDKLSIASHEEYFGESAFDYLLSPFDPFYDFRPFSDKEDSTWLVPMFCYFEALIDLSAVYGSFIEQEVERINALAINPSARADYAYSRYDYFALHDSKPFVISILRALSHLDLVDCFNNATASNTIAQFSKVLAERSTSAGVMFRPDLKILMEKLFHPAGIHCTIMTKELGAARLGPLPFRSDISFAPTKFLLDSHQPMVYMLERDGRYDILYNCEPASRYAVERRDPWLITKNDDDSKRLESAASRFEAPQRPVRMFICSGESGKHSFFQPLIPLPRCSGCSSSYFGTAHEAANHLKDIHFDPKSVSHPQTNSELTKWQGQEPSVAELVQHWVKEIYRNTIPLSEAAIRELNLNQDSYHHIRSPEATFGSLSERTELMSDTEISTTAVVDFRVA